MTSSEPGTLDDWERAIASLWTTFDPAQTGPFLDEMKRLAAARPGAPEATFELASAHDSSGYEAIAEPLYRTAIAEGLAGFRRTRASIQLASTLRNLGNVSESLAILEDEWARGEAGTLTSAVGGFLALALTDAGRTREAVSVALVALAGHLPRYNASLARYAKAL